MARDRHAPAIRAPGEYKTLPDALGFSLVQSPSRFFPSRPRSAAPRATATMEYLPIVATVVLAD